MSDNELDNLFKEAAEGFKAPQDLSAWKDMANKLDQAGVGTSVFWNWKTISTVAVVGVGVTSIALVWYASKKDIGQPVAEKNPSSLSIEIEKSKTQKLAEVKSIERNAIVPAQKNQSDLIFNDEVNKKNRSANANENRGGVKSFASNNDSKEQGSGLEKTKGTENESLLEKDRQNIKIETGVASPDNISTVASEKSGKENEGIAASQKSHKSNFSDRSASQLVSNQQERSKVANDSLINPTEAKKVLSDSSLLKAAKESTDKRKSGSTISIKLAVAPDFSSIKYFTPNKPGISYGLLVGYSFSNRWSVYTGAISSRKIYSSTNIDKPYTTSGGYPYEVNKLEGDCRVLDIPITFYYTFFPNRSFSLKAGVGISSYIMLTEDYTYHIDNPYGSDVYYQNIDHENDEWFKVMNVSLIIQKKLNNRFSLELEPFLKAPLAGVGEGEVSLVSLGAFLNLRFDLPITKSRFNEE